MLESVVDEFIGTSACLGGPFPYRHSCGVTWAHSPKSRRWGAKRQTVEPTEMSADTAFPVPSLVSTAAAFHDKFNFPGSATVE